MQFMVSVLRPHTAFKAFNFLIKSRRKAMLLEALSAVTTINRFFEPSCCSSVVLSRSTSSWVLLNARVLFVPRVRRLPDAQSLYSQSHLFPQWHLHPCT
jgi:hypothetical protein